MTETPAISCGYWKARNMPALARTSVGHVGDVVALEPDPPAGDLVLGAGQQGVGQRGLARAVRAHDGVDLAGADDQVDAVQEVGRGLGRAGPETLDPEQFGGCSVHTDPV